MQNGYEIVRGAIHPSHAKTLASTLLIAESQGKLESDTQQVVGSSICHGYAS